MLWGTNKPEVLEGRISYKKHMISLGLTKTYDFMYDVMKGG